MSVSTALCLSPEEAGALIQGYSIAAILKAYIYPGQQFAVCSPPSETDSAKALIRAWASCELCKPIDGSVNLSALACLPQESRDSAMLSLKEGKLLFLTFLRVHLLSNPVEVAAKSQGQFLAFLNPLKISESYPVVSDRIFAKRKHQLENLEPPEHPELEELHRTIAQLTPTNPNAIHLEQDLKWCLGRAESAIVDLPDTTSKWISEIAKVGNSSDGDYFEKLVRKSFIELGFTNSRNNPKMSLDPDVTGGAGGIDFFCDAPYLVIGECKASKDKKVNDNKDGAPAQLIRHGNAYLKPEEFENCIRIIMAPGQLTDYADRTASGNKMNVLQPETLQRLQQFLIEFATKWAF